MKPEKLYGLVGYPLSHSFSQKYFSKKFQRENIKDVAYKNFEIKDISLLKGLLNSYPNLVGFNVTIPYKEAIIPYLNELDASAEGIGAVNTVRVINKGDSSFLKGYNTDFHGFLFSLKKYLNGYEKMAIVFGNGGAAKAVVYALKSIDIEYLIVSRKEPAMNAKGVTYKQLTSQLVNEADILINTTPVGMWPNVDDTLNIPYNAIKKNAIAYDLIYNPVETSFMKKSKENGVVTVNGLEMLELQAEKAWEIFHLRD